MAEQEARPDDDEGAHEHDNDDLDGLLGGQPTGKKAPETKPALVASPRRCIALFVLLLLAASLAKYAVTSRAPAINGAPSAMPSLRTTVGVHIPALASGTAAAPAATPAVAPPAPAVAAPPPAPAVAAPAPAPVAKAAVAPPPPAPPPPAPAAAAPPPAPAAKAAAAAPPPAPAAKAAAAAPPPAPPAVDPATASKPPRLRLVINSHVLYSAPLEDLLQSLQRAHFDAHFKDLLVVFGGSKQEVPPHTAPGKWGKLGVTHLNVTLNAFDYNGLSAIYHYRDDPRVKAHAYLYVHDTVLMTDDFMKCFDKLAGGIGGDELQIPQTPSSNIFVLGRGVVKRYGKNFDRNFTKAEAVDLEWKHENILRYVKHITAFAKKVSTLPLREFKGLEDPYHTGVNRDKYRYPYFCLDKYLLNGKHGDIGGDGKLKPNFP